jgi:hypothetical protein
MTRLLLLAALALGGCDPVWTLEVTATAPDGEPLAGAALVLTDCPEQNSHDLGTLAALTDADGEAFVGGLGSTYPPCDIAVAKPGYATWRSSFDQLCGGDRHDCHRARHLSLVLAPTP